MATCRGCRTPNIKMKNQDADFGQSPKCRGIRSRQNAWLRRVEAAAKKFFRLVKQGKI